MTVRRLIVAMFWMFFDQKRAVQALIGWAGRGGMVAFW